MSINRYRRISAEYIGNLPRASSTMMARLEVEHCIHCTFCPMHRGENGHARTNSRTAKKASDWKPWRKRSRDKGLGFGQLMAQPVDDSPDYDHFNDRFDDRFYNMNPEFFEYYFYDSQYWEDECRGHEERCIKDWVEDRKRIAAYGLDPDKIYPDAPDPDVMTDRGLQVEYILLKGGVLVEV